VQETSAYGMMSTRKLQHQGVEHRKLQHEKQSHFKKVYYETQKRFYSCTKPEKVSSAATR
jgi:lipid II:glycine glycyltransferase (peptidoglycan interpeptide bridge formation enzyme)